MASRSLLDDIFTVRWIDFLGLSGDWEGVRATVMAGLAAPETVRRGLDIVVAGGGGLDLAVREARERRERRSGILR